MRIVLEMAGIENALGRQLGSNNALNNADGGVVEVIGITGMRILFRSSVFRYKGIGSSSLSIH